MDVVIGVSPEVQYASVKLLFQDVTNRPSSWNQGQDSSSPFCVLQWAGIETDQNGNVTQIQAANQRLQGRLNVEVMGQLRQLLPHLTVFNLCGHALHGSCPLNALPDPLQTLELCSAGAGVGALTGAFDAASLPENISYINLQWNKFDGGIEWKALGARCRTLRVLWMSENQFSGPVLLKNHLPKTLKELGIEKCDFDGTFDINSIPPGLEKLTFLQNTNLKIISSSILDFDSDILPPNSIDWLPRVHVCFGDAHAAKGDTKSMDGSAFSALAQALREGRFKEQHDAVRVLLSKITPETRPASWTEENHVVLWEGIHLAADGSVRRILALNKNLRGELCSFALRDLTSLRVLNLFNHRCSGPFRFDCLPSSLDVLCLAAANDGAPHLTGELDLKLLRADSNLFEFNIQFNNFSGSIDWPELARFSKLHTLWLGSNKFAPGPVDVACIPATVQNFNYECNNADGTIDLSLLSEACPLAQVFVCGGNPQLKVVADVERFARSGPPALLENFPPWLVSTQISLGYGSASRRVIGSEFIHMVRQEREAVLDKAKSEEENTCAECVVKTSLLAAEKKKNEALTEALEEERRKVTELKDQVAELKEKAAGAVASGGDRRGVGGPEQEALD